MTTTAATIDNMKRSLRNLRRIERDIQTNDHESLDILARTIGDLECDLHELELLADGQASTEDDLLAA